MKTYKKGISLIVLVITVIVLSILATTVIISLSETNIISQASNAVFKSDMANFKTAYDLYVAKELIKDASFDKTSLSLSAISNATKFAEIFGNNVPDKYKNNLEIVAGRLVYKTAEPELVSVLKGLDMAITVIPSTLAIGDVVEYTPTSNPSGTYSGATYVKDTVSTSATYNTFVESTIDTYSPGNLKWVYLGQDEMGNTLLVSQETTSFTMTVGGQDGWVTGPDRIDTLCNTLYGNSTYGTARNMKIEDVNRVLEYDGVLWRYYGANSNLETPSTPTTIAQIEAKEGVAFGNRLNPRLSTISFGEHISNYYTYTGTEYKGSNTPEYKVIFKKANGTTDQPMYFLSSSAVAAYLDDNYALFAMRSVNEGTVNAQVIFVSDGREDKCYLFLRPVIVLGSNIQFGEKNTNGEWSLDVM